MKLHNRISGYFPTYIPAPRYLPPDPPEPRSIWLPFVVGVAVGLVLAWCVGG
jgi:hypothetical protein